MVNDEDFGDEVYDEESLENLEEDDEISPAEEAFMEGYQKPEKKLKKKIVKKASKKLSKKR